MSKGETSLIFLYTRNQHDSSYEKQKENDGSRMAEFHIKVSIFIGRSLTQAPEEVGVVAVIQREQEGADLW